MRTESVIRAVALLWVAVLMSILASPAAGARQGDATPGATPSASPVASGNALPLGAPDLAETRTEEEIAPGVTYIRIVRGAPSPADAYAVDVAFEAAQADAAALADRLTAAGYDARVQTVATRAPDDATAGPLGYRVRIPSFASQEEAAATRAELIDAGYEAPRVVFTSEDGAETTGPWVVHVLKVDPAAFDGTVAPVLASGIVPGRERVADIAARTGALAAINGGYFVVGPTDGTPGDFAGVSLIDGRLLSEAVDGRTALLLPADGEGADVAAVETEHAAVAADGATREVDGLNREPGLIRGCGGDGGDAPTEAPKHDATCEDDSELVHFTPAFGQLAVAGEGIEAALDADGDVLELRERRGGEIPADGSVLSATGDAATWLEEHGQPGARIRVDHRLLVDGRPLPIEEAGGIVNGGPRLVAEGEVAISAADEGFHWEEDPGFYYRFGLRRNPRTMAGVTADGRLLLVAVDGRQPGHSVGASFEEGAAIMRALGAAEALNLDGGGSTALAVGPELVNRPSDPAGERPDADAIVLLP
jgi:hypothetical protein